MRRRALTRRLAASASNPTEDAYSHWLLAIFEFGYLGGSVFLAISVFVIAASVGDTTVNARYVGKFAP